MNHDNQFLTDKEKVVIRVLNFIATYDGIIQSEDDAKFLLEEGINKFIPKKRKHLVSVSESSYPIHIKIHKPT